MKTIYLSTKNNKKFYLTSLSDEEKKELLIAKNNNELSSLTLKWKIDCNSILKIGETEKITPSSLSDFIFSFAGKDTESKGTVGSNRELHYRNYSILLNKQKETSHLINCCEDIKSSLNSILVQLDNKWCILWSLRIKNNSSILEDIKYILDNTFKTKVCYINLQ